MYESLLVPTDGSEHAARAAEHAALLSRAFDADLHVIAVADIRSASGIFDAGGVDEAFVSRLEESAAEAIDVVEAAIGSDAIDRDEVIRGHPAEAIADYADTHGIDALAMGTQGRSGLRRAVMGSVTERVLRLVELPILTARDAGTDRPVEEYGSILVATDDSPPAGVAAAHAIEIADRFDARLVALHALETGAGPDGTLPADVRSALESTGEAAVAGIVERATDAGIEAGGTVSEGRAGDVITEYAGEHGVDLIVMGTTGRSGLDRYLLGSTAEHVIRRADVPVLAVHASDSS